MFAISNATSCMCTGDCEETRGCGVNNRWPAIAANTHHRVVHHPNTTTNTIVGTAASHHHQPAVTNGIGSSSTSEHDHSTTSSWFDCCSSSSSQSLPTTSPGGGLTSPTNRLRRLAINVRTKRRRYFAMLHHYNQNDLHILKHDHVLAPFVNGTVNTIMRTGTLAIAVAARYVDIKLLSYVFLMGIWFTSAVYGTIRNKEIVEHFPYPALLTASHFACGTLIDWAVMRAKGQSMPFKFDLFIACVPVSILLTFSKTFTFVSYGHVPASLTHTIKSSSPVFSVLLSGILYAKWPSLPTLVSLIPITAGVALSAITEINFEFIGFLAALISCVANVGHAMYTKQVLKSSECGPLLLHMYTSIASTLILLPYALFQEATDVFHRLYPVHDEEGRGNDTALPAEVLVLPIWAFLLSNALHYVQNMSSLYVLARVSTLRYQVTNTLKRALTILVSILHFHNKVTMMNALGMGMALTGFFWYGMSKKQKQKQPHLPVTIAAGDDNGLVAMNGDSNTPAGHTLMGITNVPVTIGGTTSMVPIQSMMAPNGVPYITSPMLTSRTLMANGGPPYMNINGIGNGISDNSDSDSDAAVMTRGKRSNSSHHHQYPAHNYHHPQHTNGVNRYLAAPPPTSLSMNTSGSSSGHTQGTAISNGSLQSSLNGIGLGHLGVTLAGAMPRSFSPLATTKKLDRTGYDDHSASSTAPSPLTQLEQLAARRAAAAAAVAYGVPSSYHGSVGMSHLHQTVAWQHAQQQAAIAAGTSQNNINNNGNDGKLLGTIAPLAMPPSTNGISQSSPIIQFDGLGMIASSPSSSSDATVATPANAATTTPSWAAANAHHMIHHHLVTLVA